MKTPIERAAQLWCLPQFKTRVMDVEFATAIAETINQALQEQIEIDAKKADWWEQQYLDVGNLSAAAGARDSAKNIRAQKLCSK